MAKINITIAIFFFLFSPITTGAETSTAPPLHLMPMPVSMTQTPGKLRFETNFQISFVGARDSQLDAAAARMIKRMQRKTGIPTTLHHIGNNAQNTIRQLVLQIDCRTADTAPLSLDTDESYELEITSDAAMLTAPKTTGILRGIETLLQLVDLDEESFFLPCVKISDHPRFRWRGVNIDVSRHWQPIEFIRRTLDAMAAVKMNVLHWHLSDDQGFRVESLLFPKLHELASDGYYYTQEQIREIVVYARDRGIRVVPEFDIPGHVSALLTAYPEFGSAPGPYAIERSFGVFDPSLNPANEKTYAFLDTFIGEMVSLFPDEYFHIGGDEVTARHWNANPEIQKFKTNNNLKSIRDLQGHFTKRVVEIVRRHGRKMIGWGEILHGEIAKDITIQSWQIKPSIADILRQGHPSILSRGFYLDHMRPASFHYEIEPFSGDGAKLTEAEKNRLLGGEACMWAEFVNEHNIESRIWPRLAVIAERLWSPATVRNVVDMYRRLEYMEKELAVQGLSTNGDDDWLLRRMTPDANAESFHILAKLLQPIILSERQRARKYYTDTPLNRLADVLLPESRTARHFDDLVTRTLASTHDPNRTEYHEIMNTLVRWRNDIDNAGPTLQQSFILKELLPVADILRQAIDIGIDSVRSIQNQTEPSDARKSIDEELKTRLARLEDAKKIRAETVIAIIPAIEKLVRAAWATPAK